LRSRYGETDKMGYVYYARYLEYFEVARTEMIRNLGFPYAEMEKKGIMLPVVDAELAYKAPVFYDEEIHVDVMVFEKPLVKLETFYKVYTNRNETPHVLGRVTLCFTNAETRKPVKAPEEFLLRMEKNIK
jgi:acyl-CoA thioester hydrolase